MASSRLRKTERLKAAILRKTRFDASTEFQAEIGDPSRLPAAPTGRPSINVLTFADADEEHHRHLGDALAGDIATELGRFNEIEVIAPERVAAYRQAGIEPQHGQTDAGTTYVLDGRLRRIGSELRVTVRLVDTQTARQVWSERYDRPADQILRIQDEIVATIVATLLGQLTIASADRASRRSPTKWRAYDYYSMGRGHVYTQSAESLNEAARCFRKAVEADPHFALAYSWLAVCYSRCAIFAVKGDAEAHARMRALALATVQKALSLDDTDSAALAVLGWSRIWNRHFADVEQIFERACRLRPCDGDMAMTYVTALVYLGKPEKAVALAEATIKRERRHPGFYLQDLAMANFFARRNSEALALLDELPDDRLGENRAVAIAACAHAGRLDDAQEQVRRYIEELRAAWHGRPDARLSDYLDWEFQYRHVYKRPEDVAYLREGLRRAGLG